MGKTMPSLTSKVILIILKRMKMKKAIMINSNP